MRVAYADPLCLVWLPHVVAFVNPRILMFRNFGMMSADEARYHLTMGMVSLTVPPDLCFFRVRFGSRFPYLCESVVVAVV